MRSFALVLISTLFVYVHSHGRFYPNHHRSYDDCECDEVTTPKPTTTTTTPTTTTTTPTTTTTTPTTTTTTPTTTTTTPTTTTTTPTTTTTTPTTTTTTPTTTTTTPTTTTTTPTTTTTTPTTTTTTPTTTTTTPTTTTTTPTTTTTTPTTTTTTPTTTTTTPTTTTPVTTTEIQWCEIGWLHFPRSGGRHWCVQVFRGDNTHATAEKQCTLKAAKLTGIESAEEAAKISERAYEVLGNATGTVWIGATRVPACMASLLTANCTKLNSFAWTDENTIGTAGFELWNAAEPDNKNLSEGCVVMTFSSPSIPSIDELGIWHSGDLEDRACDAINANPLVILRRNYGYACGVPSQVVVS